MKKWIYLGVLGIWLAGCASAQIPVYLQNKNPYVRPYYADFAKASAVTRLALEELGWTIEKTMDPLVYEHQHTGQLGADEILLVTEVRQTPMFLGTRYAKVNVYIRASQNKSEIEIRYLTVTSVGFKTMESYRNDKAVERIFQKIESLMDAS